MEPVEGREEAAGGQHEGSRRQQSPSVVHPVQVPSGHVSHADGAGGTVQELVAVPAVSRGSSHWSALECCSKKDERAACLTRAQSDKAWRCPGESSLSPAEAKCGQTRRICE